MCFNEASRDEINRVNETETLKQRTERFCLDVARGLKRIPTNVNPP